jgi:pimeloyl-ACP methyl ester carboxylesterase
MFSDLNPGPEEARTALVQAGRFRSTCRVFAPNYRQVTMIGLGLSVLLGGPDWSTPYADVRAAWRDYLRRDNGGRGVVLIGHSQGAIVLGQLLAEEIERDPAQRRLLVSAVLAGHPGVPVPEDAQVGAELGVTPLCRSRVQTGCAVVFATYDAEDPTPGRFFGRTRGRAAACVHPGAPGGGAGPLRAFLPASANARPGDPPFVEVVGQLQAECRSDRDGSVLRVRVLPGPNADMLRGAMAESVYLPSWGLHVLDMPLTQGSLLDTVAAQAEAWTERTRSPAIATRETAVR